MSVNLAGDFLDLAAHVLNARVPRVAGVEVPDRYLMGGNLQEAVDRVFTWHNARVRVQESRPERIEYHTWWFFASLCSDDCWEQRQEFTLNSETLVEVDLSQAAATPDARPAANLESLSGWPGSLDCATRVAKTRVMNRDESHDQTLFSDRRRSHYREELRPSKTVD